MIRYDARGFGQSSMPGGEFRWYEDLNGLLRFLGLKRTFLIGASMGGSTVIDFVLTYPHKAAAFIAVAAGISDAKAPQQDQQLFTQLNEFYAAHDIERSIEAEIALWLVGPRRDPDKVAPELKEHFRRMERNSLQREFDAAEEGIPKRLEPPAIERLTDIQVASLFIVGAEDTQGVLDNAAIFTASVPGAKKVVLPNVAHMIPMEAPVQFNKLALDFLASCASNLTQQV